MDLKRIASALIGFPLVAAILVFANNSIIDIFMCITALISINEFYNAISKYAKPIKWVGNIACISIAFIHVIPMEYLGIVITSAISGTILILFLHIILSRMTFNIKDIAYTFFGIFYIAVFIMYLAIIRGMNNGNALIWYAFFTSWATDVFAYYAGRHIGKHKFSKISPNKTIEGCVCGTLGAVIVSLIYTYYLNQTFGMDYSYVYIMIMSVLLSIISQIGDFAASTIKRYVDIKDFGELIPGHGGMLDRIDSLLFVAPFAYLLFTFM